MEKSNDVIEAQIETEEPTVSETTVEEETPIVQEETETLGPEIETIINQPETADTIIDEAKSMVEKSDSETKSCLTILDEDVAKYEQAKSKLLNETLLESEAHIKAVEYDNSITVDSEEEAVNFDDIAKVEPIEVKSLSSGKFGAFILALIAGVAVVIGWVYVASNALGMAVDMSKVPAPDVQNKLLAWIGGGITGGEGNTTTGMIILAFTALVVMWVVYATKVYMRETHNLKTAQKVKEDVEFYCTKKDECQREMEKISEHIHKVITSIEISKIFLDEQNAKIRRIIYIEGEKSFDELHQKSQNEIKNTNILVNGIRELISTPMASPEGALSHEATAVLIKTARREEQYKEKLYA